MEVTDPKEEPTIVVLVNSHAVRLLSKYLCFIHRLLLSTLIITASFLSGPRLSEQRGFIKAKNSKFGAFGEHLRRLLASKSEY